MRIIFVNAIFCSIICLTACSRVDGSGTKEGVSPESLSQADSSNIKLGMRDAYIAARQLFVYVWDEKAFNNSDNKAEISKLLERISLDFHEIESSADSKTADEPGFSIILAAQRDMLRDIDSRFREGKTEYARWRLQGVLENCSTCHSRLPVQMDFAQVDSTLEANDNQQRLRNAQMLFSSRQFELASSEFLYLARSLSKESDTSILALNSLKQWLLIQVRVKSNWSDSAKIVRSLVRQGGFSSQQRELLQLWADELDALENIDDKSRAQDVFVRVKNLLEPVEEVESIFEQEKFLVNTLRASGILHEQLLEELDEADRAQALYLLGLSYSKTPIRALSSFSRLYLERCIREHSGSEEARKAYQLYSKLLLLDASGSSGVHLEPEDEALLSSLKKLSQMKKKM